MAWSLRMLKRRMWPVARPDRSVLQKVSKGPLPEGACDSQPLAPENMDRAVPMPHVKIYSVTSLTHGRPVSTCRARHPPWRLVEPSPR